MKRVMLSDHFAAFAAKLLSVVDADPEKSNQHEVTGSKELRQILGDEDRKKENRFHATYVWFGGEQEAMSEEGRLARSDSRSNKHRAAERRLYYQPNGVTSQMRPGDTLYLARQRDEPIFSIS